MDVVGFTNKTNIIQKPVRTIQHIQKQCVSGHICGKCGEVTQKMPSATGMLWVCKCGLAEFWVGAK